MVMLLACVCYEMVKSQNEKSIIKLKWTIDFEKEILLAFVITGTSSSLMSHSSNFQLKKAWDSGSRPTAFQFKSV